MAIADYVRPPRIVVGERAPGLTERLRGLYDDIDAPLFEVSFGVAEMIRMVDNTATSSSARGGVRQGTGKSPVARRV